MSIEKNNQERAYEYKTHRLVNGENDYIVIREIPFYELITFQYEYKKIDKDDVEKQDALYEKYFIKESSKPFKDFNESIRLDVAKEILNLNMAGVYINEIDMTILLMSIQYKMDPQYIKDLPASWGCLLMSGMQYLTEKGVSKQNLNIGLSKEELEARKRMNLSSQSQSQSQYNNEIFKQQIVNNPNYDMNYRYNLMNENGDFDRLYKALGGKLKEELVAQFKEEKHEGNENCNKNKID